MKKAKRRGNTRAVRAFGDVVRALRWLSNEQRARVLSAAAIILGPKACAQVRRLLAESP